MHTTDPFPCHLAEDRAKYPVIEHLKVVLPVSEVTMTLEMY